MSDTQSPNRYRQLVEQLRRPQTRRTARQELVAARAVGPLLECLGADNESVVWAAVESLCELKAVEAVGPCRRRREEPHERRQTLEEMTKHE